MLAGVTITISGCGDDDNDNPTNPTNPTPPATTDRTGTVSTDAGHSHPSVTVTAAQITSGNTVTLTMSGTTHTHTVALSQAELSQVGAGTRVQKTSSNDAGHTHTVTFN
jgi:hypothetical protein